MPTNNFVFKQFEIKQDKCAMKVGTDSVLLGAWSDAKDAKKILDIGTGTGILALMLAQKSNAKIWAIDIDYDSYIQAKENVTCSKWHDSIEVVNNSIQDFCMKCEDKFDVIITNPPYFTDAYKAKEISRNTARHTDELPFDILIKCVCKLLETTGSFYLILPYTEAQTFIALARAHNLFLIKSTRVKTKLEKEPKRILMKYSLVQDILEGDELVIENDERHNYTKEFIALTKDYYLDK